MCYILISLTYILMTKIVHLLDTNKQTNRQTDRQTNMNRKARTRQYLFFIWVAIIIVSIVIPFILFFQLRLAELDTMEVDDNLTLTLAFEQLQQNKDSRKTQDAVSLVQTTFNATCIGFEWTTRDKPMETVISISYAGILSSTQERTHLLKRPETRHHSHVECDLFNHSPYVVNITSWGWSTKHSKNHTTAASKPSHNHMFKKLTDSLLLKEGSNNTGVQEVAHSFGNQQPEKHVNGSREMDQKWMVTEQKIMWTQHKSPPIPDLPLIHSLAPTHITFSLPKIMFFTGPLTAIEVRAREINCVKPGMSNNGKSEKGKTQKHEKRNGKTPQKKTERQKSENQNSRPILPSSNLPNSDDEVTDVLRFNDHPINSKQIFVPTLNINVFFNMGRGSFITDSVGRRLPYFENEIIYQATRRYVRFLEMLQILNRKPKLSEEDKLVKKRLIWVLNKSQIRRIHNFNLLLFATEKDKEKLLFLQEPSYIQIRLGIPPGQLAALLTNPSEDRITLGSYVNYGLVPNPKIRPGCQYEVLIVVLSTVVDDTRHSWCSFVVRTPQEHTSYGTYYVIIVCVGVMFAVGLFFLGVFDLMLRRRLRQSLLRQATREKMYSSS